MQKSGMPKVQPYHKVGLTCNPTFMTLELSTKKAWKTAQMLEHMEASLMWF